MSRKIIYLINPLAGTSGKSALKRTILRHAEQRRVDIEIGATNPEGDYSFLLDKIRKDGLTDVVVCGGDGSVSAVAAAIIGTKVNLGIVPLGSGNGLALSAKIPRQTAKALDIVFTGSPLTIDGFYINGRFSCMLCGIGFDAKVAHDFALQKRRGLQTYIKLTAINFFSAKPWPFEIRAEEKTFSTEAFFISIANSNQFGNNFTIAPIASLSDGLLDVVVVKKMSKLVLPFSIISQVTGINARQDIMDSLEKKNIIYFQTSSLRILNEKEAPFHIDGDPKETAKRFDVKVVPGAIRLIQPLPAAVNGQTSRGTLSAL